MKTVNLFWYGGVFNSEHAVIDYSIVFTKVWEAHVAQFINLHFSFSSTSSLEAYYFLR